MFDCDVRLWIQQHSFISLGLLKFLGTDFLYFTYKTQKMCVCVLAVSGANDNYPAYNL